MAVPPSRLDAPYPVSFADESFVINSKTHWRHYAPIMLKGRIMHRMCSIYHCFLVVLALSFVLMPKLEAAPQLPRDRQVQIVAEEMCCQGCARKVSGQLYAARGVKSVEVDMKTRTVSVSLTPQKGATLEQLWRAVELGDGGPMKMTTAEATYTFIPPEALANRGQRTEPVNASTQIVIDNLHCMDCAQKIGAELYTLKGVTKVSADLQRDTLIVNTKPNTSISPWQAIDAVSRAKERPLAVTGAHGTLSIEWATPRSPKHHEQAQQPLTRGIQR